MAGILDRNRATGDDALRATAERMVAALRHRGPDDQGMWSDAAAGIGLGLCRLAILDLSPAGHQPMVSASGRYVIAFNGEIYNYLELRRELESEVADSALALRGHSDTEVLLAAVEQWGLGPSLARLNGMFAFALWDRRERSLYLVRDRLGEKPLYYGWVGGTLLFASELKALRAHPAFSAEIDREALAFHLRYNCIPAPFSIYKGIRKLPPASVLKISGEGRDEPEPAPYWSLREVAKRGVAAPFRGSDREAAEELDRLLRDAVRLRMISDVPLGAFLSGGIDSSTVVALMQAQSERPVHTFSLGFREPNYDEVKRAHDVARHLHTEHTELYVTPEAALAVIQRLPTLYDEPFADSSQIPTFLVSQLARHYVTVALSGDGGDEVFGGYNRHTWSRRIWNVARWVPRPMRRLAAAVMTGPSPKAWDAVFAGLNGVLPRSFRQALPGDKMHKLAGVIRLGGQVEMYMRMASHWDPPEPVVLGVAEGFTAHTVLSQWPDFPEFEQQAMYVDSVTYLVNDILTKLDRASMGVSLEARVPYLDPRVVEFAWSLPLSMKIRGGEGKWILRQVLYHYVPRTLVDRPKMGFGIPIDDWLRGPLRAWAESLLDERSLREEGFFDPQPIRQQWEEHLSRRRNWQYTLWDVLMFQHWLAQTRPVPAGVTPPPLPVPSRA